MTRPGILQVIGLSKSYQGKKVLDNVDFSVSRGEVKAVLGPSGSGKSTMLRLMAVLEPADAGEIILDGERIGVAETRRGVLRPAKEHVLAHQRREIGMVFQNFNLFPHLTALKNVMLGLTEVQKANPRTARETAEEILERVGLADRRSAYPSELSGGQQQRVAIARALVLSPKVMLFDEPTSALDPELVQEVLKVMESLALDGMTMVVVTHEVGFARNVADSVAMFDGGRIVEESPPEAFFTEAGHASKERFLRHVQ